MFLCATNIFAGDTDSGKVPNGDHNHEVSDNNSTNNNNVEESDSEEEATCCFFQSYQEMSDKNLYINVALTGASGFVAGLAASSVVLLAPSEWYAGAAILLGGPVSFVLEAGFAIGLYRIIERKCSVDDEDNIV